MANNSDKTHRLNRLNRLRKLKKLGLRKGTRHIDVPPPKPRPTETVPSADLTPLHFMNYQDDLQHAAPIENVVPGQVIKNNHGQYFNVEARYPLQADYGKYPLSHLLDVPMESIALITGDDRWHSLRWQDVLFIDTETTGLEIAAGTVAFLIGVGYIDGADFVVRQVFMRDFDEEMALLHDLQTLCGRYQALASFNGKTFDAPLLENRFVLARLFIDLFDGPHLDLLHPARRLWRRRLENCKLATLETEILGLQRTQADVPGYFIPSLYRKYLVDHDARPMAGIFYHNELDIVSMAALTALINRHLRYPENPDAPPVTPPHPLDMISAGLWHIHLGRSDKAEFLLTQALSQTLSPDTHQTALTALAYLLKRSQRLPEAEACWQELAAIPGNLCALEELAKYYEWHVKDFNNALTCIDYALKTLAGQPDTPQTGGIRAAWIHRQSRVQRKLAKY